jgi:hypothetical protein
MDNFFDEIKDSWKQEKNLANPQIDAKAILKRADEAKRNSIRFQYGNAIILSITLVFYITFFYRFLLHGTLLSKIGFLIMAVPLAIRIIAELISVFKARNIKWEDSALSNNQHLIQYASFRKWMHGPVTFTIMGLYTMGYYFIMVQMSELIPLWLTIILLVAYPIIALIIIVQVRKGIRNEMEQLRWLASNQKELEEIGR